MVKVDKDDGKVVLEICDLYEWEQLALSRLPDVVAPAHDRLENEGAAERPVKSGELQPRQFKSQRDHRCKGGFVQA